MASIPVDSAVPGDGACRMHGTGAVSAPGSAAFPACMFDIFRIASSMPPHADSPGGSDVRRSPDRARRPCGAAVGYVKDIYDGKEHMFRRCNRHGNGRISHNGTVYCIAFLQYDSFSP